MIAHRRLMLAVLIIVVSLVVLSLVVVARMSVVLWLLILDLVVVGVARGSAIRMLRLVRSATIGLLLRRSRGRLRGVAIAVAGAERHVAVEARDGRLVRRR